jgi:hypothetical protein
MIKGNEGKVKKKEKFMQNNHSKNITKTTAQRISPYNITLSP